MCWTKHRRLLTAIQQHFYVECYFLYTYFCFFYILRTVELIHYIFLSLIVHKNISMKSEPLCDNQKKVDIEN